MKSDLVVRHLGGPVLIIRVPSPQVGQSDTTMRARLWEKKT
jgi:hypothetical protein